MQDREHAVQDPEQDTGTVIGADSAIGGTPASGPHGDTSADPGDATDGGDGAAPTGADTAELERVRSELTERTADLQRVSAEYANYRRRTDRDREATVSGAKAQIAADLLLVLDDVDRAAAHGDLTGGFKIVADRLTETLQRAGLSAFGAEGDAFDPSVHEAVAHETSTEVTGPTVSTVMRRGYRFGARVLRPAMVAVTDADPDAPASPTASSAASPADSSGAEDAVGTVASPSGTNPEAT